MADPTSKTCCSLGLLGIVFMTLAGCGSGLRSFPLAEPLLEDPDREHVEVQPESYYSPFGWDAVDQTVFRPITRVFAVDPPGRAVNVNALDEVPNSSWFQNRIGVEDFTVEQARQGACPENRIDTSGPWLVTAAKPDGANPGFIIQAADGRRYMMKFDGLLQPERATTADVFGSRLYHAVGFHSPCNFIVFFDRDQLEMDPEAEVANIYGEDEPMASEDVEKVLAAAVVLPDGRFRASVSLFLDGRPLGPWRYQGTRSDDPNDVIDHQDRRELRGARILAAWVNHFDAREQNTLSMWVEEEGRQYVRHNYIDFGDCFGSDWDWDTLTRRLGHSNYLDLEHVFVDFITLGLISRPWEEVEMSPIAEVFRYYEANHFEPEAWQPGYPNPAFSRMRDEDGAWMARIIAHLTDGHVRAMLDESQMSNSDHDGYLYRTLIARRDRILGHYLNVRSPLSHFEVRESADGPEFCATDLAVRTGVFDPRWVRYETHMYAGDFGEPRWVRHEPLDTVSDDGSLCIPLVEEGFRPALEADGEAPDSIDRYAVLDILAFPEPGSEAIPPLRAHFYDLGDEGFVLVGVERPDDFDAPGEPD